MCPHESVIRGEKEEFNENIYRIALNAFRPEQLAKLGGMYLGHCVHKAEKCLNEILQITTPKDQDPALRSPPEMNPTMNTECSTPTYSMFLVAPAGAWC